MNPNINFWLLSTKAVNTTTDYDTGAFVALNCPASMVNIADRNEICDSF